MRAIWIVTCALSTLGGFLLVLRLSWLCGFEPAWLPYLAHPLGGLIAGFVMMRTAPYRPWTDAIAGALVAIVLLAAVAFGLPSAFGWIAARATQPVLSVLLIAVLSAAGAAAGARLARPGSTTSPAATVVLAVTTTACTVLLGGRIATSLGMSAEISSLLIVACIATFAAAYATQYVLLERRIVEASCGIALLLLLMLIENAMRDRPVLERNSVLILVAWLPAALGAHLAAQQRAAATTA